jgi:MFS transporter, DHA2 family, multidrug resistance protein
MQAERRRELMRPVDARAIRPQRLDQALDTPIANVALPHIRGSLSAAQDQVAWIPTS